MTEDPRIESLARALCVAAGVHPDKDVETTIDTAPSLLLQTEVVKEWKLHAEWARTFLVCLDWAKANGELGHDRLRAPMNTEAIAPGIFYVKFTDGIRWNTGDSE